jgi:hypothetical protein
MILLDAVVVSELRKKQPSPNVRHFVPASVPVTDPFASP